MNMDIAVEQGAAPHGDPGNIENPGDYRRPENLGNPIIPENPVNPERPENHGYFGRPENPENPRGPEMPENLGDEEKRILVQHQLLLLLHAIDCQRRETHTKGAAAPCKMNHCSMLKQVISHMQHCRAGKNCAVPHCSSSRLILHHWEVCSRNTCLVCLPARPDWHQSMPCEQRNHLVELLFDTISSHQGTIILGQRVHDKEQHAAVLEREMYNRSLTRRDYFHLMGERLWQIEMDIEDKKRWEQQQLLDAYRILLDAVHAELDI